MGGRRPSRRLRRIPRMRKSSAGGSVLTALTVCAVLLWGAAGAARAAGAAVPAPPDLSSLPATAAPAAPLANAAPAVRAPAPPEAAPRAGRFPEAAVERLVSEDDNVRIEELRVRGQTKSITVHNKTAGGSRYEIIPSDGGRDPSQDKRAAGQRVWQMFSF
jgi:hypothetical protein